MRSHRRSEEKAFVERQKANIIMAASSVNPDAVIRPVLGEWRPHILERLDEEELADWARSNGTRIFVA
jgi:hypothetical protein